jgi:hypothetical protein
MYVFWFSRLDDMVRTLAGDLLGLSDEQRNGVMPVIDFVAVCNICKAQIKEKLTDSSEREFALNLVARALKATEDRNRVAHGYWLSLEGELAAVHVSRTSLQTGLYFFTG